MSLRGEKSEKDEFKTDETTPKNQYSREYYRKNKEKLREYNNKKKKEYYLRDCILKWLEIRKYK